MKGTAEILMTNEANFVPCNCVMSPNLSKRYVHSLKRVFVNNNILCLARVHSLLCARLLTARMSEQVAAPEMEERSPEGPSGGGELVIQSCSLGGILL